MKLIKIPWALGSMNKNPGCEQAPDAILKEVENIFLNESGEETTFEIEEVKIIKSNFEETNENIYSHIKKTKEKAIILGGDHSITYSSVKGFSEGKENVGVLMIDAHADCTSDFQPPTHEDFVQGIINQGIIKKENMIILGLRNWYKDEEEFLKKNNIRYITMKEVTQKGLPEVLIEVKKAIINFEALYLTIDIDAVDPAYAPGTGYTEVGGFSSRELITIVQHLKKYVTIADIVEINPLLDRDNLTVKLGAKIVKELL